VSKPEKVYTRFASRARKHTVNLTPAQNRALIDQNLTALTVLDKGAGTFTLIFIFPDGTELELTSAEIANGNRFAWDIAELRVTNLAQSGVSFKTLVEQQVG